MFYVPQNKPTFLPEKDFEKAYPLLEEKLALVAHKGKLPSFDNLELEYEYYLVENATATVVILHGYTEFIRKYRELAAFLLEMGFNVFIYDQRGHGLSGRETADFGKAHVSSFNAYVKDLEYLIEHLITPITTAPLYLFAHSMSGGISTLFMQKHPDTIKKAVLTAPMVKPYTRNIPEFIIRQALKTDAKKHGGDASFRGAVKFGSNVSFEKTSDLSRARFKMNMETRISDVHYQTSEITNTWLLEALNLEKQLLTKKTKEINTQILLFTAEKDTVVRNKCQNKLLRLLKNATHVVIEGAKHNIANGSEFILEEFYTQMKNFLS